jgi:hypothetical protein
MEIKRRTISVTPFFGSYLSHLSDKPTIRSSELPQRNTPNGIPRFWRVFRYLSDHGCVAIP